MDHRFPWRLLQAFYVYNVLIPALQPTLPICVTHYPLQDTFGDNNPAKKSLSWKSGWKPHNSMTRAFFMSTKITL